MGTVCFLFCYLNNLFSNCKYKQLSLVIIGNIVQKNKFYLFINFIDFILYFML